MQCKNCNEEKEVVYRNYGKYMCRECWNKELDEFYGLDGIDKPLEGTITPTDSNTFTESSITAYQTYTNSDLNGTRNTVFPTPPNYTDKQGGYTTNMNDTKSKIIQWAIDRGLDKVDPSKQAVKLMEEVGELAGGLARDNMDVIKDSLGDIYVVMVILALRLGIDLQEAIDSAYDVIKDRKGKLINGVFIKQEDLKE